MNLPEFSIKRKVTVLMITLGIVLIGIMSFTKIKFNLIPDINYPIASVITLYPGASPEEVESYISKPIEGEVALCKNVKKITSNSTDGISTVSIEFEWGTNMDYAVFDIREKVDPVIENLPEDAKRPIIMRFDPASMIPIGVISVTGTKDLRKLREISDDIVKKELEKLNGVASVQLMGGLEREILISVDRKKLESYKIPVTQLIQVLKSENLNLPGGRLTEGESEFTVRSMGQFKDTAEIENTPLLTSQDQIIRIKDVAEVSDTHKEQRSYSRSGKKDCVSLMVFKESTANIVEVCDAVKEALPYIQAKTPEGVSINFPFSQANLIKNSINNMKSVAVEGGILAVIIIFLFLSSFNATLVIAVSIPLSIITTFVLMYFKGMTFNMITMGGLTLGIGRIVDDSIVVLESIHRQLQKGLNPVDAAIKGANEVGTAVVASTITTIAAFVPVLFVAGLTQQLFGAMTLTFSLAMLASLAVALTIVPLASSRFLKAEEKEHLGSFKIVNKILKMWQENFKKLEVIYRQILDWSLRKRKKVVLIGLAIFIASILMLPFIGFEFMPDMDVGSVFMSAETPAGTSLEGTNKVVSQAEDILIKTHGMKSLLAIAGTGEGSSVMYSMMGFKTGAQTGTLRLMLVDKKDRKKSTKQIQKDVRPLLERIPGATFFSQGSMQMMTGQTGSPIELIIFGDDLETLQDISKTIISKIKDIPSVYDLDTNWRPGSPEYRIFINRDKSGFYGVTAGELAQIVRTLIKGEEVTKFREKGKEYDITIKADTGNLSNVFDLGQMLLATPGGNFVPVREIAEIKLEKGPNFITREDNQRTIKIIANKGDRALSSILKDIQGKLKTIRMPVGYSYKFAGEEKQRKESFAGLLLALFLGMALIYIILASLFESLIHPLAIMFSIPFEIVGVLLLLLLTGTTLNVMSMMGILMLTGIVVSNAVLLVDYTNILRKQGMDRTEAIKTAGPIRLRPVLMTAIATIFAMLPMALALREGSEMFKPLAIAVLGGLITSTLLTLVMVPVVYTILEDMVNAARKK